jgi:hypothetical protein
MFRSTHFLLQECENVRNLLRNTLRYAYSSKSSSEVYSECLDRLELIEFGFKVLHEDDVDELQELWVQLSKLSELIGRIERSHIEEFSWPFARALQNLAIRVCADSSADVGDGKPLFFISADDELSSYQVETELNAPGLNKRPLFNIIFPRSLKNFVLLHPILGHEVGHAAFAVPKLAARLRKEVVDVLIAGSPLDDASQLEKWLDRARGGADPEFLVEKAKVLWPEELYCDLFGLLLMGPSYVGANSSLLLPFDMRNVADTHPPGLTRHWVMNEAVEALGWRRKLGGPAALKQPVNTYFDTLSKAAARVPKSFRLLSSLQIKKATEALVSFLEPMSPALFQLPKAEHLQRMVALLLKVRPPIESKVSADLKISNENVDFRSILLAGWLAWHSKKRDEKEFSFTALNLLCDRGIQLQTAVDHWQSNKASRMRCNASNQQQAHP